MRLLLVALLCLASLEAHAAPPPAVERSFGLWDARSYMDSDSELACSLETFWPDAGRGFGIYRYANSKRLALSFYNSRWNLPAETETEVKIQFVPGDTEFTATATALVKGSNVVAYVNPDNAEPWLTLFAKSRQLIVTFPDSQQSAWTVSARGSNEAVGFFRACSQVQEETTPPSRSMDADPSNPFRSL